MQARGPGFAGPRVVVVANVAAMELPAEATETAACLLSLAGERLRGLYLTGSVTLGDYRPGVSDLDLVAVLDGPADRAQLGRVHAALHAQRPEPAVEVLYLQDGDLARAPAQVGPRLHLADGLFKADPNMVTPVIWHSLADHGVPVPGSPPLPAVHRDDAALRAWCRANLADYWADWAARGSNPATRTGMALLSDWGVAWCVLGVLRLRFTIATGQITSKAGAGRWGRDHCDLGDRPLIEEALTLREAILEPPDDRDAAAARRERVVAFVRRAVAER
jgi:hypothetical protein